MQPDDVDKLLRTIYPPTTGQIILRMLAENAGQVVGLEQLAVAVDGDTPAVWEYANTTTWQTAVSSLIVKLRRKMHKAGVQADIEAVPRQGYRLVERKARRPFERADRERWRETVLRRYDALMAEQPGLSVRQAQITLSKNARRAIPYSTLKKWLKEQRQAEAQQNAA